MRLERSGVTEVVVGVTCRHCTHNRQPEMKSILSGYSGEIDQGSGVMPISVPIDSDQVIGAERRWRGDCVRSDRDRQEEVEEN